MLQNGLLLCGKKKERKKEKNSTGKIKEGTEKWGASENGLACSGRQKEGPATASSLDQDYSRLRDCRNTRKMSDREFSGKSMILLRATD